MEGLDNEILSAACEAHVAENRRLRAEVETLKLAQARRIVVMTDHVVAMGPCAHADEESDDGTCLRLACSYCGIVRVADAVTADEESAARELLAKQEADNDES